MLHIIRPFYTANIARNLSLNFSDKLTKIPCVVSVLITWEFNPDDIKLITSHPSPQCMYCDGGGGGRKWGCSVPTVISTQ